MQPVIRYFSAIRKFLELTQQRRLNYLRRPDRDFTRASPLTFARTVSLILDLPRQSLAVELGRLFRWRPADLVTKSAFCQRRKAIDPRFFRDLFRRSARLFYRCFTEHKRWKGKRLFAVDGSGLKLPDEPWLGEALGYHQNQHDKSASVRLLPTLDLLNNVLLRVDLHTQNSAEIVHAYANVQRLPGDGIYIYDRHYASFGLAYLHARRGSDFVIRMPLDGATVVKDFVQSGEDERIIDTKLSVGRAYRKLKALGLEPVLHAPIRVRLVRVELERGDGHEDPEVEVLMTSLTDRRRYPHADFKWLYGKRWGIETAIFTLKSFLQLALTSAYTQPGVEQDLWASFAFYNQQSALLAACEAEVVRRTRHRQYTYRINRNVTAGLLRDFLYHIYLDGPAIWRSRTQVLLKIIPDYSEPYRPDRKRKRERKIMRANTRHVYEGNYRKAM
jgi:hypothetical protein